MMSGEPKVEFSLPARAENVALVRHALAGFAEALEMEAAEIADLKTVLTEAAMNVVSHAYPPELVGPLEVEAWPDSSSIVISVRDQGSGIRPLADVDRKSLRLGLPLMAALTQSIEVSAREGGGTEVTMRMPMSRNGASPEPPLPEVAEETRISLPAGQLLGPVLSRVVSMFAARADLSVDKLSDAVLLSDAISAGDDFPEGRARIVVDELEGAFRIRVGPFDQGGGQRLLDGMRLPELDASLADLAEEVAVVPGDEGEIVSIKIA